MSETFEFAPADVAPERDAVFAYQGIPRGAAVGEQVERLFASALHLLMDLATPLGILDAASVTEFSRIYEGEGRNAKHTPVGAMLEQTDHLALFAVTIGPRAGEQIGQLFESNDFALACMLDSAASVAAENTADLVENRFRETLRS